MAADENEGLGPAPHLPVTIFSHDGGPGLTAETFKELKDKYGLEVRIRTDKPGLEKIMDSADDVSGYDRTYPGYNRLYDKT